MQTILDLKQENEENAQAAARLDDDNGDEKLSLSTRINELDEALQKANTTIKLLRQANMVRENKCVIFGYCLPLFLSLSLLEKSVSCAESLKLFFAQLC
jgi:dienelactone hydrolase